MFHSIPARLTAICVTITVTAMLLLGLSTLWIMRSNMLSSLDEHISQITQGSAQQISAWAEDKRRMTSALKNVVGHLEPVPFLHQAIKGGGLDNAFYVMADKTPVFIQPRPPTYDGTQRAWYKQAVAVNGPAITPAYIDTVTGLLTISFVEPAKDAQGQLLAVVGSDVYLEGVSKLVLGIHPTEKSFAFLMDQDGNLLAHPDKQLVMKPVAELHPDMSQAGINTLAGTQQHLQVEVEGTPHMLYSHRIEGTPWTLGVVVDRADALQGLTRIMLVAFGIFLLCTVVACLLVAYGTRRMLARLRVVRDALTDIAQGEGDLTRRLDSHGRDELADIAQAFNRFADKISNVIAQIRQSSVSVHNATQEIAHGNQDMSDRTERQAHALQSTAAAMEQLTSTVLQNADHARQASQLAEQAADVATRGGAMVHEVVSTMSGIDDSSRRIVDIISVIDSIAFQTNILALNAAVEAARAGEQGRGFAVVASEVRALAQRSATAAKEIKTLIQESVSQVSTGSRLVKDTGSTMEQLVASVREVATIVNEISAATQEQSAGLSNVGNAVAELDQNTQQNAALVEESAATSQALHHQASQLAAIVNGFKVQELPAATLHPAVMTLPPPPSPRATATPSKKRVPELA